MVEKSLILQIIFDHEESSEHYLFNQWLSEDGGRLFNKRNKGLVKILSLGKLMKYLRILMGKFVSNKRDHK